MFISLDNIWTTEIIDKHKPCIYKNSCHTLLPGSKYSTFWNPVLTHTRSTTTKVQNLKGGNFQILYKIQGRYFYCNKISKLEFSFNINQLIITVHHQHNYPDKLNGDVVSHLNRNWWYDIVLSINLFVSSYIDPWPEFSFGFIFSCPGDCCNLGLFE